MQPVFFVFVKAFSLSLTVLTAIDRLPGSNWPWDREPVAARVQPGQPPREKSPDSYAVSKESVVNSLHHPESAEFATVQHMYMLQKRHHRSCGVSGSDANWSASVVLLNSADPVIVGIELETPTVLDPDGRHSTALRRLEAFSGADSREPNQQVSREFVTVTSGSLLLFNVYVADQACPRRLARRPIERRYGVSSSAPSATEGWSCFAQLVFDYYHDGALWNSTATFQGRPAACVLSML